MATRIRLRRIGRKKLPLYRIVIADQEAPRDGRFIEIIGTSGDSLGLSMAKDLTQGTSSLLISRQSQRVRPGRPVGRAFAPP